MRNQVEQYLQSIGWRSGSEFDDLVSPCGDRQVTFESNNGPLPEGDDAWYLARFTDSDNADGIAQGRWINIDEGQTLGELKLALAGLEVQRTQGAL